MEISHTDHTPHGGGRDLYPGSVTQEREVVQGRQGEAAGENAVDKAPTTGIQAIQALLARGGVPDPKQVVAILDAHRSERDAIITFLQQRLGNAYVQQVMAASSKLRASIERREVVAGDPSHAEGGYVVASQKEQGARWRTADGGFTGKVDKNGLDSTVRVDEDDAIHAKVTKDKAATVGWERDGKTQGELHGSYKSGDSWEVGARKPWEVEDGTVTTGLRHQQTEAGARDEATGAYRATDGSTTAEISAGVGSGQPVGHLAATHQLSSTSSIAGGITREPHSTSAKASYKDATTSVEGSLTAPDQGRATGSLVGRHQLDPKTQLTGSLARTADRDAAEIGVMHHPTPDQDLSAKLRHEELVGKGSQTTLDLSERSRSPNLIQGFDLTGGTGVRDHLSLTGSAETRLDKNLYAGAWGNYTVERGHPSTVQLGASLTFTPHERAALTIAGVVDGSGMLETRLQLDVFQSKINSLSSLSQHKKDALVSIFVSHSNQVGGGHALDTRFGAPQMGAQQGQWMGGVRIKF
ncbi:MAG: hypothetical protein JWP01_990 [Myxococcales bacterium]|nr:hypothetical protein [Myxococcales bacterium]